MFNLLPDTTKKAIKSEYKLRLLVVVLSFVVLLVVVMLTLTLPSWLDSFYTEKDLSAQVVGSNKTSLDSKILGLNKEISFINQTLLNIDSKLSYQVPSFFIDRVISEKTESIKINEIVFTSRSAGSSEINILGLARNRDSLLSFVKRLEDAELFSSVVLPISNFTKDRDIPFSINLKIETKQE